jgi:hypothetical protein
VPGGFVQQPQGYGQPAPQGYPQQPQYGQQQSYAAPQYAPAPQYYPQPEQPPVVPGNLDSFYNQPAVGGGKSLKFEQLGQFHDVVFPRDVADSDVQAQMEMTPPGVPPRVKKFRDGSTMYVLVLPLLTMDGQPATHYVRGPERERMIEAMQRAGVQPDADGHYRPKKGDRARITYVGNTPTSFGQPRKDRDWQYVPATQAGGGMNTAQQFAPQPPAPAPVHQPQQAPQVPGYGAPMPQMQQAPNGGVQQAYPPAQQPPMGQFVAPQPEQAQPTPGAAAPAQGGAYVPAGMDPSSPAFAAFQQLIGQAAQPQQ